MSNVFSMIFGGSSAPKLPFGGKRHTLTAEDRAKAAETRRLKAEARKAEEAAAKAQAKGKAKADSLGTALDAKRTGSPVAKAYYASPVHEAFNFLCSIPADANWQLYGNSQACDSKRLVARLSLDIPGLRMLKHAQADLVYVLVFRATGTRVCVLVKGDQMAFAVDGEVSDECDAALDMIRERATRRSKQA